MPKPNDRRQQVGKFHLPERGEKVFRKIEVYYNEGGVSMWSYEKKPRGFYIASKVVRIEGGFETWTVGQEGDGYIFVDSAQRFNRNRLNTLVTNATKCAAEINRLLEERPGGTVDRIIHLVLTGDHNESSANYAAE